MRRARSASVSEVRSVSTMDESGSAMPRWSTSAKGSVREENIATSCPRCRSGSCDVDPEEIARRPDRDAERERRSHRDRRR